MNVHRLSSIGHSLLAVRSRLPRLHLVESTNLVRLGARWCRALQLTLEWTPLIRLRLDASIGFLFTIPGNDPTRFWPAGSRERLENDLLAAAVADDFSRFRRVWTNGVKRGQLAAANKPTLRQLMAGLKSCGTVGRKTSGGQRNRDNTPAASPPVAGPVPPLTPNLDP